MRESREAGDLSSFGAGEVESEKTKSARGRVEETETLSTVRWRTRKLALHEDFEQGMSIHVHPDGWIR